MSPQQPLYAGHFQAPWARNDTWMDSMHAHEGQFPYFAIPHFQIYISVSQLFMFVFKPGNYPIQIQWNQADKK